MAPSAPAGIDSSMLRPVDARAGARQLPTRRAVRVSTFNIHYGAGADDEFDLAHTTEMIRSIDPDVIGLQEVDKHFRARSNWLDIGAELAKALRMHLAYGPNVDLDPSEPGQPRRQYGCAILSRWPIRTFSNLRLPQFPDSEPRGLLEAVIEVDGQRIRVGNAQMQHTTDEEWQAQADAIVASIDRASEPYIFVGDTNATPDFVGTETFTAKLADVWDRVGVGSGLTAANTWRFDYIFVPEDSDVRCAWLTCTDASDHLPLTADLVLAGSDPPSG